MAFQHLIAVFFVLLGLALYLKTDQLIASGEYYKPFLITSLLINTIASFCCPSVLILPSLMMLHIFLCSKNETDRARKYDIWLPAFVPYLFYPLLTFSSGNGRLLKTFGAVGLPVFVKFLIIFLSCLSFLIALRFIYSTYKKRYDAKKITIWLIVVFVIMAAILIKLGGLKRLLIPYNLLVPFAGMLASFLEPVQNALLIDSSRPYHFIPFQLNAFYFLLSFVIIGVFIKNFVLKNKAVLLLGGFYLIDMLYLYLWNPVTSRYLIYLSPVFCIIFCAVLDYFAAYLTKALTLKKPIRELMVVLIFISVCVPNLLAIKVSLVKGVLSNTFPTYDYIRAAHVIKRDFYSRGEAKGAGGGLSVHNIPPIAFTEARGFFASDPRDDNARFVFKQVFNDSAIDIRINQASALDNGYRVYYSDAYNINDKDGINVNRFNEFFEKGLKELRNNQYGASADFFRKAASERPFLLSYTLGDLRLEDLPWLTNGLDMRVWVNKIGSFYILGSEGRERERSKYILELMNRELEEYIECLFYAAFLKNISGDAAGSKYWFSQIRFLDNNYKSLHSMLSQAPLIRSNNDMLSFLEALSDASLYVPPENYIDRFKFEKFIFRLTFSHF